MARQSAQTSIDILADCWADYQREMMDALADIERERQ